MAGWGLCGARSARRSRALTGRTARPARPGRRLRACGHRLRRAAELLADGDLRRRAVARALPGALECAGGPLRRRPRDRQRRLRARRRAGDGADAAPASASASSAAGATTAARPAAPAAGAPRCCRRLRARVAAARPRAARPARRSPAAATRSWLVTAQNGDGGFGDSRRRDVERGDDRLGDARARGRRPQPARRLAAAARRRSTTCARTPATSTSTGDLARTILALEGAGVDPRDFGGRNLVSRAAQAPRATTAPSRAGRTDRLRGPRPARGRRQRRRSTRSRVLAAQVPRTATAAGATSPGRPSNADITGAVMQALARLGARRERGARLPAQAPARRRRLRARRQRPAQHAVDRLGGAGDDRRRRRPGARSATAATAPSTTSPRARPATATTATRRRATRPRSGSPARCWSPSAGKAFPIAAVAAAPAADGAGARSRQRRRRRRARAPAVPPSQPVGAPARRRVGPARRQRARPRGLPSPSCLRRRRPAAAGAIPQPRRPAKGEPETAPPAAPAELVAERRLGDGSDLPWIAAAGSSASRARPRLGRGLVVGVRSPGPPLSRADPARSLAGSVLWFRAMDVETAIRTRRTHKAFAPEPLPREEIERAARAGALGAEPPPDGPWRFRVVGPGRRSSA